MHIAAAVFSLTLSLGAVDDATTPGPFHPVLDSESLPSMEEARILRGTQIPTPNVNPDGLTGKTQASIRKQMSAVKSQGGRGTCSVFAAVALLEQTNSIYGTPVYSEQCLAHHMGSGDPGQIGDRLDWALANGVYRERDCRYEPTEDRAHVLPDLSGSIRYGLSPKIEKESFGWFSRKDPIAFIRKAIGQGRAVGASIIVAGDWWEDRAPTPDRLRTIKTEQTIMLPPHIAQRDYPKNWPADWPPPNPDGSVTIKLWSYIDYDLVKAMKDPTYRELLRKHHYQSGMYPTGMYWDSAAGASKTRTFDQFFAAATRLDVPSDAEVKRSCERHPDTGAEKCGSHAIVFTGYDDETQTLEFKNSWGRDWKNSGYGYMSYAYYRRFHVSFSSSSPLIAVAPEGS